MGDEKEGVKMRRSESAAIVSLVLSVLLVYWLKVYVERKIEAPWASISKSFETL